MELNKRTLLKSLAGIIIGGVIPWRGSVAGERSPPWMKGIRSASTFGGSTTIAKWDVQRRLTYIHPDYEIDPAGYISRKQPPAKQLNPNEVPRR